MDAGVDELLGNGVRSSCSETAPLSEGVEVNCGEIDAGFSQIRRGFVIFVEKIVGIGVIGGVGGIASG
jgi:hypothetical protein